MNWLKISTKNKWCFVLYCTSVKRKTKPCQCLSHCTSFVSPSTCHDCVCVCVCSACEGKEDHVVHIQSISFVTMQELSKPLLAPQHKPVPRFSLVHWFWGDWSIDGILLSVVCDWTLYYILLAPCQYDEYEYKSVYILWDLDILFGQSVTKYCFFYFCLYNSTWKNVTPYPCSKLNSLMYLFKIVFSKIQKCDLNIDLKLWLSS